METSRPAAPPGSPEPTAPPAPQEPQEPPKLRSPGQGPGWLDLALLGSLLGLGLALLEMAAGSIARDPLTARPFLLELHRVTRVLWLHAGFGAALGALCLGIARRTRRIRPGAPAGDLAVALLLAGLLAVPALARTRDALAGIGRLANHVASLFAAVVVALLALAIVLKIGRDSPGASLSWRTVRAGALAALGLLAVVQVGDACGVARAPRAARAPDIVLISLDTVRADHLGVYGYPRPTSPSLDAFAGESVRFEHAYAPEPWTLASHMTMMTGLEPIAHGVLSRSARLNPARTTLATALGHAGYRCLAFVGAEPDSWLGAQHGFALGFDEYHHAPHGRQLALGTSLMELLDDALGPDPGSAADVLEGVADALDRPGASPLFLFVHFYDAHSDDNRLPYESPPGHIEAIAPAHAHHFDGCDDTGHCASRYLASFVSGSAPPSPERLADIVDHYDAGIHHVDQQLGRLFALLRRAGIYDRALIVVTADHGEELFEHGRFLHTGLFREALEVPLLFKLPARQQAGHRVSGAAGLVDLMPTVLDLAGVPIPPSLAGRSLRSAIEGQPLTPRALWFSFTEQWGEFRRVAIGVEEGGSKLVVPLLPAVATPDLRRGLLLFDLAQDPEERVNLASDGLPPALTELHGRLLEWRRKMREERSRCPPQTSGADADAAEHLRALGYIGY